MSTITTDIWEMLIGRTTGPLTLRLILQPTVAAIFAIRGGLADAREGSKPYFWSLLFHPSLRPELLRSGWKDVRKVFLLAIILDAIYQVIVLHWIYPFQALLVAAVLALVPYILIRGVTGRIAGRRMARG